MCHAVSWQAASQWHHSGITLQTVVRRWRRAAWCRLASPVDGNASAADEAGVFGGEEEQHARNLVSFGPATEVGIRHGTAISGRIHDTGQNGVHCDVGVAQLFGLHLGEGEHSI